MTLDDAKKCSEIAAPFLAAIVAFAAFKSWRRELHGKSRFEAARKLLLAAMELRDQVKAARSPLMGSEEWKSRPKDPNERPEVAHQNDFAYAYYKRLEKVDGAVRTFSLACMEATVFWYVEVPELTRPILRKVVELGAAAHVYFTPPSPPPNRDERERFGAIIFGGAAEDPFAKELDQGVHKLEEFLRQWIGKG